MFSTTRLICTLFDHRYMSRGICMINSLRRHGSNHQIWVLCLDAEAHEAMTALALPGVNLVTLADLERHLPKLVGARKDRPLLEYYFTCMAPLHRYLFDMVPEADGTMYIDADIVFFDNPDVVFDCVSDAPAAITPHNFPERDRIKNERFGIYNAGWTLFRRTPEGEMLLNWWVDRSIEWCQNWFDNGRYANQGYLNWFSEVAPDIRILRQKGFNCAPWNLSRYAFSLRDGRIFIDDEPLVFFHFHGVRREWKIFYFNGHRPYHAPLSRLMRNNLYRPYVAELVKTDAKVAALLRHRNSKPLRTGHDARNHKKGLLGGISLKRIKRRLMSALSAMWRVTDVLSGRTILVIGTQAW